MNKYTPHDESRGPMRGSGRGGYGNRGEGGHHGRGGGHSGGT